MGPKKIEKKTKPQDSDADFEKTLGNDVDGFDGEGTGQFSHGSGRPIRDAPGNNWSSDEDKSEKDSNGGNEERVKLKSIDESIIQKSDSIHNLNVSHEE